MKKLLFAFVILISVISTSCSGDKESLSIFDNAVVVLPSGDELSLYMNRGDVEGILGYESEQSSLPGILSYDDVQIGFTDDKLTFIDFNSNAIRTKTGIELGDNVSILKEQGFVLHNEKTAGLYFSYNGGELSLLDGPDKTAELFDVIYVSVFIDNDESISTVNISDANVARTLNLDK